jgi:hypothetical protein
VSYYMEMEDGSIDLARIFNVNRNVGLNLMSRKPDVMLVQHALNTVMAKLDLKEKSGKTITTSRATASATRRPPTPSPPTKGTSSSAAVS